MERWIYRLAHKANKAILKTADRPTRLIGIRIDHPDGKPRSLWNGGNMKHFGDITKINGSRIEPVSVITFGSPCQDLSIAGRRAGLQGERSGLFLEAVKIIKEMREATNGVYPAFAVWENVPGAFSSNKGEDFRQVLQELARLCDNTVSIPRPPKKWLNAGAIMGDSWSIAWRILDAQYWGVPQRRRRIALVVDFGGNRAAEILFNPESVQWNSAPRRATREAPAGITGIGAEISGGALCRDHRAGEGIVGEICGVAGFNGWRSATGSIEYEEDRAPCINASSMPPNVCAGFMAGQGAKAGGIGYGEEIAPTLKGTASGSNQIPCMFDCRGNGGAEIYPTITGDHQSRVTDYTAICTYQDVTGPLMANSHPGGVTGQGAYSNMLIAFTQKRFEEYEAGVGTLTASVGDGSSSSETILASVDCRNGRESKDMSGTIQAKPNGGYSLNYISPVRIGNIVRRLVPLECERLQGYPDGWTDIPGAKDTPRYKALGNSIALPVFYYVLYHVSRYLPPDATLGSLFDGIGGFPLIWERLHGRGTARWASEIEPFPIAVTKYRF